MDDLLQSGLIDWKFSSLQCLHFFRVVVDADDIVADISEASAGHQPDITGANDRKIHDKFRSRGSLVAPRQPTREHRPLQLSAAHGLSPAPAGSKLRSKPNLGNALSVKVSKTPYSLTPPLSRTTAPNEATQLVRSR